MIVILTVKKLLERFKKEWQEANHTELRIGKVIKGKSDKPYVKWKGYDNS